MGPVETVERVRYRRTDSRTVPAAERFEYWRAEIAPLKLEPIGRNVRDFRVQEESLTIGADIGIIEMTHGPATTSWGREVGIAQNRLRLIVLGPAPGAAAHWYGRDVPLDHGAVALLGATDGGWRVPANMRGIQVDLPRAKIPISDTQLAELPNARLAGDPVFTTLVRPTLTATAGNLAKLARFQQLDRLADVWTSLMTMLIASAADTDAGEQELGPARRLHATTYIAAHLADPDLTPATVAAALHISRRTLYNSLDAGANGIAAQIRTARLAAARTKLVDQTNHDTIADIAAQVGLTNPAHFSRAFHREYGDSPRELRHRYATTDR